MSSPTAWTSFHCENPDFIVRSIPDDVDFAVNRAAMQTSEVFRDMFSCCDTGSDASTVPLREGIVDLHEPADTLVVLLRLLHYPPPLPVLESSEGTQPSGHLPKKRYDPASVIPLPILFSLLYRLADKYALPNSTTESLNEHLFAHAPSFPIPVYGFACCHGMDYIASEASQYMMPLASYRAAEIAQLIPTVEAYHKIVRLQDLRLKVLRNLLLEEDIFPYGYGACPSHRQETNTRWDTKRKSLALKIDIMTDVAGEMATITQELPRGCKECHKACNAAVEMLAYKCRKAPRSIDHLPEDS